MASRAQYTPLKPYIQALKYQGRPTPRYTPIFDLDDEEIWHKPAFKMPKHGVENEISSTIPNVTELFLSDALLDTIVKCTNNYAAKNEKARELQRQSEVTRSDILRFFAIYYYMGVVRLPCKRDYWPSNNSFWPLHPVTQSMSRTRYEFIWRNIHMTEVEEGDVDEEDDIKDEDDLDVEVQVGEDDEDNEDEEEPEARTVDEDAWYAKVKPLIDKVLEISRRLCKYPGTKLSIDEMMNLFKGRSIQTYRMQSKPIKEGYKFFALCDQSTGYVFDFIPDGRKVSNPILDMITSMVDLLLMKDSLYYLIGMDNYFTTERVLEHLSSEGVGFVGTGRGRINWPPAEYRAIKDTRFNTLYTLPGCEGDYVMCRWVDNNIVYLLMLTERT